MTLDTIATNFVEDLDFPTLIAWADILKVDHHRNYWTDDDEPNREDELRVAVAEAMLGVGKKTEPFDGSKINPMPLGDKEQ